MKNVRRTENKFDTMIKVLLKSGFVFILFVILDCKLPAQIQHELYTVITYPVIPQKYCDLNEKMRESSGIILFEDAIWTINDSGGEPEIYKIDKESGEVSQTVRIENGSNVDWEDITQDDKFIYVGDFGNNNGNRKDLKIYKIPKSGISQKKKINVDAEVIYFSFSDQTDFTENSRNHNYDCESLISFGDDLVLFSKNWENNHTKMYCIPKSPGNYSPKPSDNFDADGLITGADYFDQNKSLILIGYKNHMPFMLLLRDFNGKSFGDKSAFRFDFVKMMGAQTEGIAWLNEETVVFSTEQTREFEQQVWELNLQKVFDLIK